MVNHQTSNKEHAMRFSPEHADILLECRRRTLALETDPEPPAWKTWEVDDWLEQAEHGPFFSIPSWFDTTADYMRMRYLRAIGDLEGAGLLVTYRRWGRKLTAFRLTDAGMKLAGELEVKAEVTTG
jgi:hypothetical protein